MSIPKFKRSKRFLDKFELPCLFAKIKNSKLPGVATRYIAEFKEDPACAIYLRGKNHKEISGWQKKMLEQLFEQEGLATTIAQVMKAYEKQEGKEAYNLCDAKELNAFKKHGIVPFMTISTIVIDDITKEVIIDAGCDPAPHFSEHGLNIYLRNGRWRFDDADYFFDFQSQFEDHRETTPEELKDAQSAEILKMAAEAQDVFSGLQSQAKQWEKIFPLPRPRTPAETDPAFLFGDWEFDARKTAQVMKQLGQKKSEIQCQIEGQTDLGRVFYRFSPKYISLLVDGDQTSRDFFCGCQCCGKRVKILYRIKGGENILTSEHWYDGEFLVDQSGLAYRRVKDAREKSPK